MLLVGQTLQSYKGLSTAYLLRFAKAIGMELVELNLEGTNLNNVETIIPLVDKTHVTFHLPIVGLENFDLAEKGKEKEIKEVITLINKYGNDLNLILGVVHPPEGKNGSVDYLIENIQQLNLPVVVENVMGYSDEQFIDIYSKMKDGLGKQLKGWLFDVAHSYIVNGKENYLKLLDKMPFSELEEIHLSDCLEGEDSHYAFGYGVLPIDDILQEIKRRSYNKILVNEIDAHPSIWAIIDSYQKVAKIFKKGLYYKVTLRKAIMKPIIQHKLKKAGLG